MKANKKTDINSDAKKRDKEIHTVEEFIKVYCKHNCKQKEKLDNSLCQDCNDLLSYAKRQIANCPHINKPKCKDCKIHCFEKDYRSRIRNVMKFSGMHFVKRGRIDWLIKYFMN